MTVVTILIAGPMMKYFLAKHEAVVQDTHAKEAITIIGQREGVATGV